MKINSGIYLITNIANNKKYIGSSYNVMDRIWNHKYKLRINKHDNPHLQNAWDKYGEDNFKFEIIETVLYIEDLLQREQYYINIINPEYNILKIAGNCSGRVVSEETKEKISKKLKGCKLSEETRKKISEATKGEKNPFYGKKHSEATLQKLRNKPCPTKGKKLTEEHKKRIGAANKGKKHLGKKLTEEHKKRIGAANKGKKHLGKKLTEEHKKKISKRCRDRKQFKEAENIIFLYICLFRFSFSQMCFLLIKHLDNLLNK